MLFCGFFLTSFSQQKSQNEEKLDVNVNYESYFKLPRTSLYLHLNKSSYLRGENIWFQGYAYSRQIQKLDKSTRNIEVGIYDNDGNLKDSKLFLAIDGIFSGQVSVDSTYNDGEYYLKAETNYMKNFEEDYSHLQKFEILGEESTTQVKSLRAFDLQVLPEGGQIVVDCKSTLGVKLINQNGQGVSFTAELLEDEKSIFNFTSNKFGHAKVDLVPRSGKNYSVKVILPNDDTIVKRIDNIKQNGFVLSVNNILPKQSILYVASNLSEEMFKKLNYSKLMIHQEGKHFEIPLQFANKKVEITKSIRKDQLFEGINTVTLIINDKPIAERLIFNRKSTLNSSDDIVVKKLSKTNRDSINLQLNIPKLQSNSNLSISVLPEGTISYVKNQNISSAFLIDPFVNGHIEDKTYYFTNPDRRVDYDLDLLLMIQGWSKYTWDNMLSKPPELKYLKRDGLTQNINLNGRVPNRATKLLLYSTIFNQNVVLDLDGKDNFKLENRYPLVGEKIEVSLITDKEKFLQPNFVVGTELDFGLKDLSKSELLPSILSRRALKLELDNTKLYSNFMKGELLNEVIIKAEKEEQKKENYATSFKDNTATVDEDFANTYPFLSDYLSTKGYIVRDSPGSFIIRPQSRISLQGRNSPVIFLNGILLNDFSILGGSRTSDYEEIYVDRSGYGAGVQGAAGVIRLQQRIDALFTGDGNTQTELPYSEYKLEKGFEVPKQFYMPEYSFYQTDSFKQIGTIGWFSNMKMDANDSLNLKIFDTGLKKLMLYIEGISEDGKLINIEKPISL